MQIQVLASSMALALIVAASAILFLEIYAYTTSYKLKVRETSVYDVIQEKPAWTACSLASELLSRLNAVRVSVNITEYRLSDSVEVLRAENCTAEALTKKSGGYTASYTYTTGTVYGTIIKYSVEVVYA
ncbi:MAG: hypothetical protein OWQ48_00685 [Desulfurococcus sp.]|nr:hypothetical protein [Desulfurococcus sp.]